VYSYVRTLGMSELFSLNTHAGIEAQQPKPSP